MLFDASSDRLAEPCRVRIVKKQIGCVDDSDLSLGMEVLDLASEF